MRILPTRKAIIMKTTCISLLALLPAVSIAAPLPAGVPVYGASVAAPAAPAAVQQPVQQPVTLSAPAPAAEASPIMETAVPAPDAMNVPYTESGVAFHDVQRFGFSMHMFYGFNGSPSNEFATDVFGVALQGAWFFTPHQALTFDITYAGGSDRIRLAAMDDQQHQWMEHYRFYRSRLSFMPGYEVRVPLNPGHSAYFYAGAKAGLDISMLHVSDNDHYYYHHGYYYEDMRTKATAGFAYAGTVGFSFRFSRTGYVDVAYQYFGSTAEPDVTYSSRHHYARTKLQARSMRWHEVHLGVGTRF